MTAHAGIPPAGRRPTSRGRTSSSGAMCRCATHGHDAPFRLCSPPPTPLDLWRHCTHGPFWNPTAGPVGGCERPAATVVQPRSSSFLGQHSSCTSSMTMTGWGEGCHVRARTCVQANSCCLQPRHGDGADAGRESERTLMTTRRKPSVGERPIFPTWICGPLRKRTTPWLGGETIYRPRCKS